MPALAINCGSSNVKIAVIDTRDGVRQRDLRIDLGSSEVGPGSAGESDLLASELRELLRDLNESVELVVHRIVHGGERFAGPVQVDDAVAGQLIRLEHLAPLHNRLALQVMADARARLPEVPHVAVFDTSFHSTLPAVARAYALPPELCANLGIRRFGFHGLSHAHVAQATASASRRDVESLRILSCHLGGGSSVTAIQHGKSIETSMGMTPLEGLVMGTRAGDVDPGILLEILRRPGMDVAALEDLLYRRAGMFALAGTADMRDIEQRAARGDSRCEFALALYAYRVRKYMGAYAAAMGGVDVIAFTGGVGENSAAVRQRCLDGLEFLGVGLDRAGNGDLNMSTTQPVADLTAPGARVRILVVRADEEGEMVRQAQRVIRAGAGAELP